MGKVYSLEEYRLKRDLKELRAMLTKRIEYCEKNGYLWLDHYTIKNLHEQIGSIVDKIKRMRDERPS